MNSQQIIHSFYSAFQQKNAAKMIELYHDDIIFSDPAFGELQGEKAKAMWQMLCKNAKDLTIEFSIIDEGKAFWEARYTFSQTGRKVHNKINAEFEFKDGKIIKHTDHFNLHRWAGQAMGLKGKLLGGTAFFKKQLQAQTNRLLERFMSS